MKQYPTADKIDRQPRDKDNQLGNQDQRDKAQITIPDTRVHQALR